MNPSLQANPLISQWLAVDSDGVVSARTGKSELGQGISTALAQIVADELGVNLADVHMSAPATTGAPDEGFTAGSLSIQQSGTALSLAARSARQLFTQEAEERLGAPVERIEHGRLHAGDSSLAYADLAGAIDLHVPINVELNSDSEPNAQFTSIGRSIPRRDLDAKILGSPAFIQDLRLPGMRFARVIRPPFRGAVLQQAPAVDDLPGDAQVVLNGSFIAVVASLERHAIAAYEILLDRCRWSGESTRLSDRDVAEFIRSAPTEDTELAQGSRVDGDSTEHVLTGRYSRPFVAHASIGTSCAIAQWDGEALQVWSHTQGVFPLRRDIARALDLDESRVIVQHVEGAGCYGHNPADDVAYDAALVARDMPGAPIQVTWTRKDELGWGPMAPAMVVDITTTTDDSGHLQSWTWEGYGNGHSSRPSTLPSPSLLAYADQSGGRAIPPSQDPPLAAGAGTGRNALPGYDIPCVNAVAHRLTVMPIRASAMRSLGAYLNVFAIESHIDELAHQHGLDPLEYRLRHLTDSRARHVLESVARLAGWGVALGEDRGRGIGFARYKNTGAWCAVIAEVEAVEQIHVEHLWIAVDCGRIVNPDGVRNQIEGGAIQSVSWTLQEEVRFADGAVTSDDWETYPILRFPQVPTVTTHLVESTESWLGSGEASSGPTAAAIGNAVRSALGLRVRALPLTQERIVAAMTD